MAAAAWICLLLPLASAVADHARRDDALRAARAGYLATVTTFGAFIAALVDFF